MNIKTEKGKHYTSAQSHRDEDGLSRNFTMINHDVKTSIALSNKESIDDIKKEIDDFKKLKIKAILSLPAVFAPTHFDDFKDKSGDVISWKQDMVTDACMINDNMRNSLYLLTLKRTVQEQYWYSLTMEDVIDGSYKSVMVNNL